jgi:hypothetical protein
LILKLHLTVWRYVFVADFGALSCQAITNFNKGENLETGT